VTEQELLLRATLAPEPAAREAYRAWRAQADLATLDRASQRVLALLAERLDGDDDAVAEKVRRIGRFTWLRTQVLLERAAPGIRALTDAGIPVLLIKGAAVLAHTGWQVARRPMDDLDIAVPRALAAPAAEWLVACGFEPPFDPTTAHFDELHALGFRHPSGAEIDLHWHVLHESLHRDADADFFAAAQPAQLRDVACSVLCREDAFLQAVIQGREPTETHPLRWAADAAELLRAAPSFDWARVHEQARRHRLTRELREGLTVLAELGLVDAAPRAQRTPRLREEVTSWLRREVAPGAPLRPRHGPLYLKHTWALPRARAIPRHALWRASGRRFAPPRDAPGAKALGASLRFQHGEPGTRILGRGWWAPDAFGTWSRGREAVLVLPVEHDGPLKLAFEITPFVTTDQVLVTVDGAPAARWRFSNQELADEQRTLAVPARLGRRHVALRFASRPRSPLAAGYSGDPRPLGLALRSLRYFCL
jgi:hypothetical protein